MLSNTNIRSRAWNNLKQDIGIAVGAIILFFIVSIVMSSLPFIGLLLQIFLTGALYVGYCFFFLKIARNEKAEIEDLFMPFKSKKIIVDSIITYLLSGLIIAFVFIICLVLWVFVMFGGFEPAGSLIEMFSSFMNSLNQVESEVYSYDYNYSIYPQLVNFSVSTLFFSFLFIVLLPCTIVGLGISQAYYLLADGKPKNGLEAITMSWNLMNTKKIKFLLLQLSFIGWIILSIFTLFFGFLILAPYISSSYATFYDNLDKDFKNYHPKNGADLTNTNNTNTQPDFDKNQISDLSSYDLDLDIETQKKVAENIIYINEDGTIDESAGKGKDVLASLQFINNVKGIDIEKVVFEIKESQTINDNLPPFTDVDGNWHVKFKTIMKCLSENKFERELNKLLKLNNIPRNSAKVIITEQMAQIINKSGGIPDDMEPVTYFEGEGFNIEISSMEGSKKLIVIKKA